jgi:hypothetical protein
MKNEDKNFKRAFQGKRTRCRHSRSEACRGAACRGALWWGMGALGPGWTQQRARRWPAMRHSALQLIIKHIIFSVSDQTIDM